MDTLSPFPPLHEDPWITLLPPAPEEKRPSWSPWATVGNASPGPRTIPYPLTFAPLPTLPPIPPGALGPPTELLPPARLASIRLPDPWIAAPEPPLLLCHVEPAPAIAEPPEASAEKPAPAPSVLAEEPAPAPRPDEFVPLEQYARMEALIAYRPDNTEVILEKNGLDAQGFQALTAHWQSAIKAELREGKSALVREYDAAFVAELESARGPLVPTDFARLSTALERDDLDHTLRALDLPRSAVSPIQRMAAARPHSRAL